LVVVAGRQRRFHLRGLIGGALHLEVELLVLREPGAGGDEPALDDVLLVAAQLVDLAV
jgi:hypothetical protein